MFVFRHRDIPIRLTIIFISSPSYFCNPHFCRYFHLFQSALMLIIKTGSKFLCFRVYFIIYIGMNSSNVNVWSGSSFMNKVLNPLIFSRPHQFNGWIDRPYRITHLLNKISERFPPTLRTPLLPLRMWPSLRPPAKIIRLILRLKHSKMSFCQFHILF